MNTAPAIRSSVDAARCAFVFSAWFALVSAHHEHLVPWVQWSILAVPMLLFGFSLASGAWRVAEQPALPEAGRRAELLLAVAAGLAIFVLPILRPFALATLAALAWGALRPRHPAWQELSTSSALASAVAGLVAWGYWTVEPFLQQQTLSTPLFALLGSWLGIPALTTAGDHALVLGTDTLRLSAGPRFAALLPAGAACALLLADLWTRRLRPSFSAALTAVVLLGSLVAREVLVLGKALSFEHFERLELLEGPWIDALVFLPFLALVLLLTGALGQFPRARTPASTGLAPTWSWSLRSAFIGGLALLCCSLTLEIPGSPKQGRIAIDGAHSEWEWSDVPLDRDVFGSKTTYNLWTLQVLLQQYYPVVDNRTDPILSAQLLEQYDLWILKTPTRPYTCAEVDALEQYVRGGGGLWLVGEHTDIFGIDTNLNPIAQRFGLRYATDALSQLNEVEGQQRWMRAPGPRDPALGEAESFFFLTSDSLVCDPCVARPLIVGNGLFSDDPDYSVLTFFGDMERSAEENTGRFIQSAAAELGSGRVVAFTDSTTLSSFAVLLGTRPAMFLATIQWLNHTNGSRFLPRLLFALGLLLSVGALLATGLRRWPSAVELFASCALAAVLGLGASGAVRPLAIPHLPQPNWTQPRVAVLAGDGFCLQTTERVAHDESSDLVFDTFYVWMQRASVLPLAVEDVPDPADYPLLVLLDQSEAEIDARRASLQAFLQAGGSVWVIANTAGVARSALGLGPANAGLEVVPLTIEPDKIISDDPGMGPAVLGYDELHHRWIGLPAPEFALRGLAALLSTEGGEVVHGLIPSGAGNLIVTAPGRVFSNATMGSPTGIPTEDRFLLSEVLWATVDRVFGRPEQLLTRADQAVQRAGPAVQTR